MVHSANAAARADLERLDPAEVCDQAARVGADAHGVPLDYLRALTRTETGRSRDRTLQPWPWTVNMEGVGRWFDNRAEALAYVRKEMRRGARSFDVGCFQINYHWHGDAFASVDEMFDPAINARYAARFLSELKAEGGGWPAAVGRYHSRTPALAAKYSARFNHILGRLGPPFPNSRVARLDRSDRSKRTGVTPIISFPRFTASRGSVATPMRGSTPVTSPSVDRAEGAAQRRRLGAAMFASPTAGLLRSAAGPLFRIEPAR